MNQNDGREELRETLKAAFNDEPEVETPEVEEPEVSDGRERDEKGRFVAKAGEDIPEVPETAIVPETPAPEGQEAAPEADAPVLSPPNGWSAEAKAKWHELPAEVQAAANQRETDVHKQISKHDEERNFGRELYRVVNPYLPQIQAEGGTPASAVQSLLNTAYVLRTGHPEQKKAMLLQVARQYGVDLTQQPQGEPLPPYVQSLHNELNQIKSTLTQGQLAEQTRLQTEVQQEIEAFATDPTHTHYSEVKAHMAALLREGAATDMKDAYDQACWARPDIRATLLATQRAEEEQKRRTEAKAKAEVAKRKGLSITGGPGSSSNTPAPESRSLRETLEANFAASIGAV